MNIAFILLSFLMLIVAVWLCSIALPRTYNTYVEATLAPEQEINASEEMSWMNDVFIWALRFLPFFVLAAIYGWTEERSWLSTIGTIGILIIIMVLLGAGVPIIAKTNARFVGSLRLPKVVYVGDSYNIAIHFDLAYWNDPNLNESIQMHDSAHGKLVVVNLLLDKAIEKYFEVELLAAGIIVDGDKRQRQDLSLGELVFRWNCHFQNSGSYLLILVLRLVTATQTVELGVIEHRLKVVKVDHLTQRQVWVLASVAWVLSGIITMGKILIELNLW
jgi:hypothetical protein